MHRYPDGAGSTGFWHKARPKHAPRLADRLGQPGGGQGRDRHLRRRRRAGHAAVGRELRRPRVARLDVEDRPARPPDVRDARHRSRHRRTTWDDVLVLARLHRTALEHLGVRGRSQGDRAPRHPDLGADRARPELHRHPGVGRAAVARGRCRRTRAGQLEVGGQLPRRARPGWTTPRTRSTRRWSRRTARGPARGRPGVGADQLATSSTTRTCGRTASRGSAWHAETATPRQRVRRADPLSDTSCSRTRRPGGLDRRLRRRPERGRRPGPARARTHDREGNRQSECDSLSRTATDAVRWRELDPAVAMTSRRSISGAGAPVR